MYSDISFADEGVLTSYVLHFECEDELNNFLDGDHDDECYPPFYGMLSDRVTGCCMPEELTPEFLAWRKARWEV